MKKEKPKYNQILDAAVEVIAENGFHRYQVSKIAKKAGVADGTIYLYFKNKEDLLVSLFQNKMGNFIERIRKATENVDKADEKLFALIDTHFRQLSEDPHLAVVTQLELRQSDKRLRAQINDVLKGYLHIIDSIIQSGMEEKTFHNHLNIKLVRQMIFGMLDEVVTNWVMQDQRYDLNQQAKDVHFLISNGLKKHT